MNAVFVGQFENAMMLGTTTPYGVRRGHPYYDSLMRNTCKSLFDYCAPYIMLADKVVVPAVDWAAGMYSNNHNYRFNTESINIEVDENFNLVDIYKDLAANIICSGHLSAQSMCYLSEDYPVSDLSLMVHDQKESFGNFKGMSKLAFDQLTRILSQIDIGRMEGNFFVISQREISIINDVVRVLYNYNIQTPIYMPNFDEMNKIDVHGLQGRVLNFNPIDYESLHLLKNDKYIHSYLCKIKEIMSSNFSKYSDMDLYRAILDVHGKSEAIKNAKTVVDVFGWVFDVVPGLNYLTKFTSKKLDKEGRRIRWHTISSEMNTMSLSEYLSRKTNY